MKTEIAQHPELKTEIVKRQKDLRPVASLNTSEFALKITQHDPTVLLQVAHRGNVEQQKFLRQ